jgi:hypothetical protein
MNQVGKPGNGNLEQQEDCPDQKVNGCPQFEVEICQNPEELNSDTIVLSLMKNCIVALCSK